MAQDFLLRSMSQLKLKALFGGEKEIVEPPVRRKPGRPRKEREVRDPEEDETIAKVSHEVTQVLVRNDDVREREMCPRAAQMGGGAGLRLGLLWGLRAGMSFTLSVSAQVRSLRVLSPLEPRAQGMSPSG